MSELERSALGGRTTGQGHACPECCSTSIETRIDTETFTYGVESEAVELKATVPVFKCQDCAFEWLDHLAERAKHDAVCRHLCLLTPSEVTSIREKYGLSKAKFSKITGLGVTTIARWERGILIQNEGNDALLRLLAHPENLERLNSLRRRPEHQDPREKFPSIVDLEQARRQQAAFALRG